MARHTFEVGAFAPQFTLPNQDGEPVSLAELQGQWVVLYFYPKDDTPGCTTEACQFSEAIQEFAGLNAVVLGCSPDSPSRHRKFREKYGLHVMLLADPEHRVMEQYGAWGEKKMYGKPVQGVVRSTVLIDPQGRVAHHWPTVKADGHAAAVRDKLQQLQR